jgi:hypothetical protein
LYRASALMSAVSRDLGQEVAATHHDDDEQHGKSDDEDATQRGERRR